MTHKEKLIELYTIAVKKYKEAEEGVIWEYSGRIGEDLLGLEIEVQKMIEKFSKTLQELDAVEVVRLKEKIDEIVAELDAYCEKAYRDYEETSDYYYVGVARAFESVQQIVEKHLGSDEE